MMSALTVHGNTNSTVEVGQGNLKLLFSVDGGKLAQYINNKNSVSGVFLFFLRQTSNFYGLFII